MRRRVWIGLAAFAASGLVAFLARAIGAPSDQYDIFNKTDPTITDAKTGLDWQRYPSDAGLVQFGAVACPTGFRLPTYKELLTLVDEDPHYEYDPEAGSTLRYIDPNAFPGTPADNFWSLSADRSENGWPKMVNFGTGRTATASSTNQEAYVRCVK